MQKISKEKNLTEAYLTAKGLARRWKVTLHTLEQWRWKGRGPHFFKLGSCVRYPREEIERFEMNLTSMPNIDPTDKRFLCIDIESLVARQEEEKIERKELEMEP